MFLCGALVLVSIVSTIPVVEMGLNDDWSFTYIARELAASGHFHYSGWSAPIVGVQAWWGALIIRLAGFSFTAVRLSTAPFAVGCSLLLYSLGRRAGLNASFALFGTLAVVLSPVFIPLAASFMTDVPGFFLLLACFWCGVSALDSENPVRCFTWLTAAAVTGIAGGTTRQIVWGAPLLMIPAIVWSKRKDVRILAGGLALWGATSLAIGLCLRWFRSQQYVVWDTYPQGLREFWDRAPSTPAFMKVLSIYLLLMLPVLAIYFVFDWRRAPKIKILLPVMVVLGAVMFRVVWMKTPVRPAGPHLLFGNIITPYGMLDEGSETMGSKPIILSDSTLFGLALMVLGAGTACATALLHSWREHPVEPGKGCEPSPASLVLLCGPFFACYLGAVFYRISFGGAYDRYLIPLLPALTLPLLWHYQHRMRARVPVIGWLVLGAFGVYGVAATHDYISAARGRLSAASALTVQGVSRTKITAGLEYDGWTELEASKYITLLSG